MPRDSDSAPPELNRASSVARGRLAPLVDALVNFTIHPDRWDAFTAELERNENALEALDPRELLAALSKAESLAWRLKNSTDSGFTCSYFVLDGKDRALSHSNDERLKRFVNLDSKGAIRFENDASANAWSAAKHDLRPGRGPVLFEATNATGDEHRFGYLVRADEFPAARLEHPDAELAVLFAPIEETEKLARVLQSSFGLTVAETNLTLRLVRGLSLKQSAEAQSISINTARNQLQAVFEKVGIGRQPDLILVITQLSIILATSERAADGAGAPLPTDADYPPYEFEILPDARQLAFRRYGEAGGMPVLYLHETYGSSRLPPGTDVLARELGLSIVAVERPGTGFSTPDSAFGFDTVARDVVHFLDNLGIERVAVIGFLSGGAFALFCAAALASRVDSLTLVAARTPTVSSADRIPRALASVQGRLSRNPWLLNTFLNILRNRASHDLNRRLIANVYGAVPSDAQYLREHPEVWDHMAAYTLESMAVSAGGASSDMKCFTTGTKCDLDAIRAPITLWHGDADAIADFDRLQAYLENKVTRVHRFPGFGSLVLYRQWRGILGEIAAVSGPPSSSPSGH